MASQRQLEARHEAFVLHRQQEAIRGQHEYYPYYNHHGSMNQRRLLTSNHNFTPTRSPVQGRISDSYEEFLLPRQGIKADSRPIMDTAEAHHAHVYQRSPSRHAYHDEAVQLDFSPHGGHTFETVSGSTFPPAIFHHSPQLAVLRRHTKSVTPASTSSGLSMVSPISQPAWLPIEETQTHKHVDPNALSLSSSVSHNFAAFETSTDYSSMQTPRSAPTYEDQRNETKLTDATVMAAAVDLEADHKEQIYQALAAQLSPEGSAGDEDGRGPTTAEQKPKSQSRPSSSVDGAHEVEGSPTIGVRPGTEPSESEAEQVKEDSDSDYTPHVELRSRRRVSIAPRYAAAQPKRGTFHTSSHLESYDD